MASKKAPPDFKEVALENQKARDKAAKAASKPKTKAKGKKGSAAKADDE